MTEAPDPPPPAVRQLRISDADRERAVTRLQQALSDGRLDLPEYDERVARAHRARTAAELAPLLADLPGGQVVPGELEHKQLRTTASTLRRTGRWTVPRRLSVHSKAGTVKLDFTEAVLTYPVVEVDLDVYAATVVLVLPRGGSVDCEPIESSGLVAGSVKVRGGITRSTEPAGQPHVVVTGKIRAGTVVVRRRRRFLGRHW